MNNTNSPQYRWRGYGIVVALLHIAGIGLLIVSMRDYPTLLGLGFLAYTLGLRHAFDADHIAAIDNTVRKLVQQKKNPMGVGFYFSLGHSSVVCCMAVVTAFAAKWAEANISQLADIGGIIGTSVSGVFLVLIGVLNFFILSSIFQVFRKMRNTKYDENQFEELLQARGFMARLLGPMFKFVSKSWHVYPIGFLFGLGFDTASEVALMAISAGAAKSAIPIAGIISLPLLFAAGMSLLDTADGIFMTTAYKWAFRTPLRKVYYNLTVTGLSVVAALVIGMIELAQVLGPKLGFSNGFWQWVEELDFGSVGYILVIIFVVSWAVSYGIWKWMRIEERWGAIDA
ncbi:HoxN/HupN/NixA family nickel/cobalt transporter [Paenibacillus thalictri]|uniref:Nickel/cobalt efflux system n=1 Tax=Paenibacillus thalictri TaxID=2527873 RepID=A0A4Q9DXT7_9BACL|nr:HoxN/HupN/NixA family nickel/cobalt transporter [Paenibacillus thalictri]TBL81216.1 HoxN/HupN/NixA family nickel/cobalt transporter [Paenibacillus thalictri]